MREATLPILLMVFGAAWLAHELGWLPDWKMIGAILLIGAGVAVLASEGITKSSVVSGPMLIFGGAVWLARQHDLLEWNLILPIGLIAFGLCLFVARLAAVPRYRGGVTPGKGGNQ